MASLFTKIINGEIPSHKIAEDDRFLAFLDVFPLQMGHTLVVPKKEVDYIFDLDPQTLGDLHIFAQPVAKAIEKVFNCKRIGTAVVGLEVPHAHLHLVPLTSIEDINFGRPKLKPSQEELAEAAEKIRAALKASKP